MVSQQPTPPVFAVTKLPWLYPKRPVATPASMSGSKKQRAARLDGTSVTSFAPSTKRGREELESDTERWSKTNKRAQQINNEITEVEARPIKRVKCHRYDGKLSSNEIAAIAAQSMPLLSIAHLMTPASREDTDVLRRVQANLDRNLHPAVKKMRQEDAMRDAAEKERLLRNIQLTVCLEANSPIDKVSLLLAKFSDMTSSEDEERARRKAEKKAKNEAGYQRYAAARRQMEAEEVVYQRHKAVRHAKEAARDLHKKREVIYYLDTVLQCITTGNVKNRNEEEKAVVLSAHKPPKAELLHNITSFWIMMTDRHATITPETLRDVNQMASISPRITIAWRCVLVLANTYDVTQQELLATGWQIDALDRLDRLLSKAKKTDDLCLFQMKVESLREAFYLAKTEEEISLQEERRKRVDGGWEAYRKVGEETLRQDEEARQQQHIEAIRQDLSRYDDEICRLTAEARHWEAEANRLKKIRELEDRQRKQAEAERKQAEAERKQAEAERKSKEQELERQREKVESAYDKLLAANTDNTPLAQLSIEVPSKQWLLDRLSIDWQRIHSDLETVMPEHFQDAKDVVHFDLYIISGAQNAMLMLRLHKRLPQELIGTGWQLPILDRLSAVLDAASGGVQLVGLKGKVDAIRWLLQEAYSELAASATVSPTPLSNSLSSSTSSSNTETSKAQETTPDTSPEREHRQMLGAVQEKPSAGSDSEYSPSDGSSNADRWGERPIDVDDASSDSDSKSDSDPNSEQSNDGEQDMARNNNPFAAPLGHYEPTIAVPVNTRNPTGMNGQAPSTPYSPRAQQNFQQANVSDADDEDLPHPSIEVPEPNCELMPAQESPRSNYNRTKNSNRGKASSSFSLSTSRTTEKNGIRRKDDFRSLTAARQLASVRRLLASQAPSGPAQNRQSRSRPPQETPAPSRNSMPTRSSLPTRLDRSLDDIVRETRNAGRNNGRGNGGSHNGRGNGGNKRGRGHGGRSRGGRR